MQVSDTTLDALIRKYGRPDYIKMDIEGYELSAIKGLDSVVNLISFEYHLHDEDIADKLRIIERLKQRGAVEGAILAEGSRSWTLPWVGLSTFLNVFPGKLPREAFYGDIFVRSQ